MPSSIGFLLSEIPSFFSRSSLRREEFQKLFETMDPDNERSGTPSPFQKFSTTRWLVRAKCLYNLLMNWHELKAYFSCAEVMAPANIRYKVSSILNMLKDETLYLFISFLTPVVQEFERLNSLFQGSNVDPEVLFGELELHHRSLRSRVFDSRGYQLPLPCIDFGAKFLSDCQSFILQQPAHQREAAEKSVENTKIRCLKFLMGLLAELEKRLPENKGLFQGMSNLSPQKVLSQFKKVPFRDLPLPHLMGSNSDIIEHQYRKISHVDWAETSIFSGSSIPKNSFEFWSAVQGYCLLDNNYPFQELANYCLSCLILPISNAFVERVFSQVTYVKNKQRNRMSIKLLDSVIRIKSYLMSRKICCKDFVITPQMLEKCNSSIYEDKSEEDSELPLWLGDLE
jgi:hypothetical protein